MKVMEVIMMIVMVLLFIAAIAVQTYTDNNLWMFLLLAAGWAVYFLGVAS